MTVATLFQILLTSKAFFRLMSFLKSFVPSMRWNFWSLQQDCRVKIRQKTSSNHYLSSRKIVEFSFSFLPPPTIYGYRSVIIIEVEIWISVRIKKSVIWGLSTFKLKSKYTVIFVDFVVCGFIKTCHVDGANYSLAQFEHNWNKSVPMMTVPCRKEAINAIKKSNFGQKVFEKTWSEAWTGLFITLAICHETRCTTNT